MRSLVLAQWYGTRWQMAYDKGSSLDILKPKTTIYIMTKPWLIFKNINLYRVSIYIYLDENHIIISFFCPFVSFRILSLCGTILLNIRFSLFCNTVRLC